MPIRRSYKVMTVVTVALKRQRCVKMHYVSVYVCDIWLTINTKRDLSVIIAGGATLFSSTDGNLTVNYRPVAGKKWEADGVKELTEQQPQINDKKLTPTYL